MNMLSPFLVIGVGGSGGKTLRTLRQALLRKLRVAGWPHDRLPEGWQFLEIDTISVQGRGNFSSPLLPPDDYLGLVPQNMVYDGLKSSLLSNVSSNMKLKSLGGWLPDTVPVPITLGAGQYRTLGRAIAMAQISKLAAKLKDKHSKLSSPNTPAELKEATRLLGGSTDGGIGNPTALVITSLAGGSGAGMFLDVAEALKSIDPRYEDRTHLFLYGPDVFKLPEGLGDSIPANALAAAAEVMAGLWSEGPGEGSAEIFQRAGLTGRGTKGFGAKYTYIVGASNTYGVSFEGMDDVFHATGESLTSLIANEEVNTWLNEFLLTNVFVNTSNELIVKDASKLKSPGNNHHYQPLGAIGIGRVSLGLDRFTDYLAEGCSRLAVEKLLWPKYHQGDSSNPKTPTELVEEETQLIFPEFLNATGLDERDPANDVIDALIPTGQEDRVKQFVNKILTNAALNVDQAGLPSDQWIQRITNSFQGLQKSFEAEETGQLHSTAQSWTENVQDKIINATSLMASRVGLQVTLRLIQKLREEVSFTANQELPVTAQSKLRKLSSLPAGLSQKIPAGMNKIQPAAVAQQLGPVLKEGADLLVDASRMNLAAEIMVDLEANLLAHLEETVKNKEILLRDAVDSKFDVNNEPNLFPSFTNLRTGAIPSRFNSSVVERLLIPTNSYPKEVERLVKSSVVEERRANWMALLTERITLGTAIDEQGDSESPDLFIVQARWVPQKKEVRKYDVGQQKASFNLLSDPMDYFDRARKWLLDSKTTRTQLGKYLTQDLVTFLSPSDPSDMTNRRKLFSDAFAAAIEVSAPLVRINTALTELVHSNVNPTARYLNMSVVPFPSTGSYKDLYDGCKASLEKAKMWDDAFEKQFKVAAGIQEIDFFSAIQKAMNPMVFDSLMKPAYESWSKQIGNSAAMRGYWTMRRARPLSEFLPAAPEVIKQMMIGWFISILLGQRKVVEDKLRGPKVTIWDAEDKKDLAFPHPMLPIVSQMKQNNLELLPTVLKSLVLAFAECNNSSSLEPMKAYWRLLELGSNYQSIMSDWISSGQLETDAPVPDEAMAGSRDGDLVSRKAVLLKILSQTKTTYSEAFEKDSKKNDPFSLSKVYELKDQILDVLNEIQVFVDGMTDEKVAV
jgi:hypothetical protein